MTAGGTGTQPDVLRGLGLRRVVVVLSLTQITSWGVLYYAFAALSPSITTDTGWSSVEVTGAFSLGQLVSAAAGIWVGRHLDANGPRRVMTAGSLIAVPAVLLLASATDLVTFYVGWVLAGLAMAGTLYPPAFAAVTRWGGEARLRALTTLTLVGGLASTVFAPLASALDDRLGWRGTYLVLLVGLVVVTVPLHWWGLHVAWTRPSPSDTGPTGQAGEDATNAGIAKSPPFLVLTTAFTLTSLCVFAVVVNLVPMLEEQGMSRNLAALVLGLGGVGQVVGRLGYHRFDRVTTVEGRTVVVVLAVAAATAALAVAPSTTATLVALGMLLGLARGAYTLLQATAVSDRWGTTAYGSLNGLLTAPGLVAAAAAPFVGAALAQLLGSYAHAFLLLSALAAVAALVLLTAPRLTASQARP